MADPNPNRTQLDGQQILQNSYDGVAERIRVDADVTAIVGELELDIDQSVDSIQIYGQDDSAVHRPILTDSSGKLQVVFTTSGILINIFNEQFAVVSGSETQIVSYTVPSSTSSLLKIVSGAGGNTALYSLKVNGIVQERQYTYFGSSLNTSFNFSDGLKLISGDLVTLTVLHNRPSSANFNASIKAVES